MWFSFFKRHDITEELDLKVKKLQLGPDDIVVITVPTSINPKMADKIRKAWDAIAPTQKVVVLDNTVELKILTQSSGYDCMNKKESVQEPLQKPLDTPFKRG